MNILAIGRYGSDGRWSQLEVFCRLWQVSSYEFLTWVSTAGEELGGVGAAVGSEDFGPCLGASEVEGVGVDLGLSDIVVFIGRGQCLTGVQRRSRARIFKRSGVDLRFKAIMYIPIFVKLAQRVGMFMVTAYVHMLGLRGLRFQNCLRLFAR